MKETKVVHWTVQWYLHFHCTVYTAGFRDPAEQAGKPVVLHHLWPALPLLRRSYQGTILLLSFTIMAPFVWVFIKNICLGFLTLVLSIFELKLNCISKITERIRGGWQCQKCKTCQNCRLSGKKVLLCFYGHLLTLKKGQNFLRWFGYDFMFWLACSFNLTPFSSPYNILCLCCLFPSI